MACWGDGHKQETRFRILANAPTGEGATRRVAPRGGLAVGGDLRVEFEDGFDLDGDVAGEGAHADGAAGTDAGFVTEDLGEEFGAAVDDLGVLAEVGGGVDHAEEFDDLFDAVEGAELVAEGGEHGEAGLAGGLAGVVEGEFGADLAGDVVAFGKVGAVAGEIGEIAGDDDGFVDATFGGSGWEGDGELGELGFGAHGVVFGSQFSVRSYCGLGVVEELAIFPEVAEAGDEGEEGGEVDDEGLDVGMAAGVGFEDGFEEFTPGFVGSGFEHEIEDGDDLPEHLVFAEFFGGEHDILADGDLADACDEEFAREDDDGDPGGEHAVFDEDDESGGDEDFIGEGIEEFAEVGDEVAGAGDGAVEVVGDGGGCEDEQGDAEGVGEGEMETGHEHHRQNQTGEGKLVGEVHGVRRGVKGH